MDKYEVLNGFKKDNETWDISLKLNKCYLCFTSVCYSYLFGCPSHLIVWWEIPTIYIYYYLDLTTTFILPKCSFFLTLNKIFGSWKFKHKLKDKNEAYNFQNSIEIIKSIKYSIRSSRVSICSFASYFLFLFLL